MDKMREQHIKEMEQLRMAIARARSAYVKRDLAKAIKRKEKELRLYDRLRK